MNYEPPWQVDSPADCYWYHSMHLPGIGEVQGDWDLRGCAREYLGGGLDPNAERDFMGKTCLDVGAASGHLSFLMESKGGIVTSFDQSKYFPFDLLPDWQAGYTPDNVEKMKRGYWFAHKAFNSHANVYYGNIYDLPLHMGPFDYAVLGSILLHVENPVGVIRQVSRVADSLIITDVHRPYLQTAHMVFRPSYPDNRNDFLYWWYIPKETMIRIVESFGFAVEDCYLFKASGKACGTVDYYCIVAKKA